MVNRYVLPDVDIYGVKTDSSAGQTGWPKKRHCTTEGNWVSYKMYFKDSIHANVGLDSIDRSLVLGSLELGMKYSMTHNNKRSITATTV